ncbi:MAG TPA: TIGR00730 family Rossman fold protein [Chitinophagales bacterium]|nr:TIGR00730 family Rossman fold protein [Chitinophagales bacterium]
MVKKKNWSELKADSSWRMFKIMSEFVDGFEKMERFGPCISIFGSARTKPDSPYYKLAVDVAERLSKEGYGIITGGGPGIMEAGNRGAKNANGRSVGLHIELEMEKDWNEFIDADKLLIFKYFFARKVMFIRYAQAFVFLPGGFGTMDEMFEALTLIQTHKVDPVPVILIGKDYWEGLFSWIKKTMLNEEHNIHEKDLDLFELTDDPKRVVKIINNFYKKRALKPKLHL